MHIKSLYSKRNINTVLISITILPYIQIILNRLNVCPQFQDAEASL